MTFTIPQEDLSTLTQSFRLAHDGGVQDLGVSGPGFDGPEATASTPALNNIPTRDL